MELSPGLQLGWLNGWLLLAALYGVFGLVLWMLPRQVVTRLYDRSGWSKELSRLSAARMLFALPAMALIIFTPLKLGSRVFMLGLAVFALGLVGLVVALINFRDTPPDQPAVKGLYRVSRNPQAVAFFLANYAICIAIGSWIAAIMLALAQLFAHFRIVAEEQSCLRQYGASYRGYMQRVPRYFLFF